MTYLVPLGIQGDFIAEFRQASEGISQDIDALFAQGEFHNRHGDHGFDTYRTVRLWYTSPHGTLLPYLLGGKLPYFEDGYCLLPT